MIIGVYLLVFEEAISIAIDIYIIIMNFDTTDILKY